MAVSRERDGSSLSHCEASTEARSSYNLASVFTPSRKDVFEFSIDFDLDFGDGVQDSSARVLLPEGHHALLIERFVISFNVAQVACGTRTIVPVAFAGQQPVMLARVRRIWAWKSPM
jgi:hypothetical protein